MQLKIGDSIIMLSDEYPDMNCISPQTLNGSPVAMYLYVADADAAFAQAIKAGANEIMPVQDMFWGDRHGQLVDPFGHRWSIATQVEDLTPEELRSRAAKAFGGT